MHAGKYLKLHHSGYPHGIFNPPQKRSSPGIITQGWFFTENK
jgi:hypothetical protein